MMNQIETFKPSILNDNDDQSESEFDEVEDEFHINSINTITSSVP